MAFSFGIPSSSSSLPPISSLIGVHHHSSSSSSKSKNFWLYDAKKGTVKGHKMSPKQRRFFFWKANQHDNNISNHIQDLNNNNSSSSSSSSIITKPILIEQFLFNQFQFVIREITFRDIFSKKKKLLIKFQVPNTRHFGLYYPHALGELIGCISLNTIKKRIYYCKTFPNNNKFITTILLDYVYRNFDIENDGMKYRNVNPYLYDFLFKNEKEKDEEDIKKQSIIMLIGTKYNHKDLQDELKSFYQTDYLPFISSSSFTTTTSSSSSSSSSSLIEKYPLALSLPLNNIKLYPLNLQCKIKYNPILAGKDHETPFGIYVYISSNISPSGHIFVPYDKCDGVTVHTFQFLLRKPYLPPFSIINFDTYANFINTSDEECINQSGYANLSLPHFVNNLNEEFKQELFVPNSHIHRKKGELYIHCISSNVQFISSSSSSSSPSSSSSTFLIKGKEKERKDIIIIDENSLIDLKLIQKSLDDTTQMVMEYIKKYNQPFYKQHPASSKSIECVTVYNYACRKGRIPGCMFDIFKLPISYEQYYLNALLFAIRRRFPQYNSLDVWNDDSKISAQMRVYLAMDMLCIYVNYAKYITDIVDYNTPDKPYSESNLEYIESFDPVRCRDSCDCEDCSKEILTEVMEIKYNRHSFNSSIMLDIRTIFEKFVFVSTLCGVSENAISMTSSSSSSGIIIDDPSMTGHECAVAIPNYIFFKALARGVPSHPLLSYYSEEEKVAGKGENLYVLEGTGNLYPEPREKTASYDTLSKKIQNTFSPLSLKNVNKQFFYHPTHPDGFYKMMVTLMTPEFFLRFGYRGVEFLICIQQSDGTCYRGVSFSNLLNIDSIPSIRIYEAPTIPIETFRAALRMDDDNFPSMPLKPISTVLTNEMKKIVSSLTRINRKDEPLPKDIYSSYSFQIRFDALSDKRIKSLILDVNKNNLNMICLPEPVKLSIKGHIGGYTIIIF